MIDNVTKAIVADELTFPVIAFGPYNNVDSSNSRGASSVDWISISCRLRMYLWLTFSERKIFTSEINNIPIYK